MQTRLVLTCEHAVNFVPPKYRAYFLTPEAHQALQGHRGYDPGARQLFEALKDLAEFSAAGQMSRLLLDLNRSAHHRSLLSEFSRLLPEVERRSLMTEYYDPFRRRVREAVQSIKKQRDFVLHISVHTFTPVLVEGGNELVRKTGVGILYDPARSAERRFAGALVQALRSTLPARHGAGIPVHRNQPYRGVSDGHTAALRKTFRDREYAGLELEVRQDIVRDKKVRSAVIKAVASLVN